MGNREKVMGQLEVAKQLTFGIPRGISVEGATRMNEVVEFLYGARAATLGQIARQLPDVKVGTISDWLTKYPYIDKRMTSIERYDVQRHKWIRSSKIMVYTLEKKALVAYEIANHYTKELQYPTGKDGKMNYVPQNIENALYAIELLTRLLEVEPSMEWLPNHQVTAQLKTKNKLDANERLGTSGFIRVAKQATWGIAMYVKITSGVIGNAKRTFPTKFMGEFNGIVLVRGAHLGRVHELGFKKEASKGIQNFIYRFMPYEFSLEHPRWFLETLYGERWAVLEALIENEKYLGSTVEETLYHTFHYRITHPADIEHDDPWVEYVDTTYGVQFGKFIEFMTVKQTERARYTLYVVDESEMETYPKIAEAEGVVGLTFRLIDWPGGTK